MWCDCKVSSQGSHLEMYMKSTKSELWEVCMLSVLLRNLIIVGLRAGPQILTFLLTYRCWLAGFLTLLESQAVCPISSHLYSKIS